MDDNEDQPLLELEKGLGEDEVGVARHSPASRPNLIRRLVVGEQPRCLELVRVSTQIPRSSLSSFSSFSTSHSTLFASQNSPQVKAFHPKTEGIIPHTILEAISERSSPVSTMASLRLDKSSSADDKSWLMASESTYPSSPNMSQRTPAQGRYLTWLEYPLLKRRYHVSSVRGLIRVSDASIQTFHSAKLSTRAENVPSEQTEVKGMSVYDHCLISLANMV